MGSFAADLDTDDSPLLGPLLRILGSRVQLTVADYRALAAVDVDLLWLLDVDLAAGTLHELVDGSQLVGLADFYLAIAEVLARESGATAQVRLLQALAVGVGSVRIPLGRSSTSAPAAPPGSTPPSTCSTSSPRPPRPPPGSTRSTYPGSASTSGRSPSSPPR
ncbi:hypothetical protein [Nocardioides sp. TF02-7]|uniref:hypothetical protein n=1 Tax=Nocardioides sp. TF02-7 TaxID=2917724 RepID=UPI001F05E540|nr:hypothetical protein [Nocardioides sp. TF02-7]UMG91067.1 hypothetical protein MF408_12700 [Nocardioides sp. TF02-7]